MPETVVPPAGHDDPWLPVRLADRDAIRTGEVRLRAIALAAIGGYLDQAKQRVLAEPALTAAGPADAIRGINWRGLVEALLDAVAEVFRARFAATSRTEGVDAEAAVAEYLDHVWNRLGDFPDDVHDALSAELAEGIGAGETIDQLRDRVSATLGLDRWSHRAERIARTEVIGAYNGATTAAALVDAEQSGIPPSELRKRWLATDDDRTRPTHDLADGQVVPFTEEFTVGGFGLAFPGDPTGPPQEIVQCRCTLLIFFPGDPDYPEETVMAAATYTDTTPSSVDSTFAEDQDLDEVDDEVDPDAPDDDLEPVPWSAVLAPEGVMSGDGRQFADGALRWRELPLPLLWQKATADGHDGAVVVGRIDKIWREDSLIKASGVFDTSEDADEVMRQVIDGMVRGVSVDVDDVTFEVESTDDGRDQATFTDGRIASATVVATPAFSEAGLHLGEDEATVTEFVSEEPWDGSASRFTSEQWKKSTILHVCDGDEKSCHKLPIREPGGALSRAGVHNAAARFNQVDAPAEAKASAKRALRGAYSELSEEPPDVIAASAGTEEFVDVAPGRTEDGPGWLTHPVDTDRLRDYWVRGAGAAKIGWGTPGDFNRCRTQLAKYVKPQYLSGYCANRHFDALGFWPGQHSAETVTASNDEDCGCSLNLTAASAPLPPAEWFVDPALPGPTALTITDDRRVFGHLATFGTCHIGIGDACVTPPTSESDYAYFATGEVRTTDGPVRVGQISLGGGHADPTLGLRPAIGHYDATSAVVADVAVGEDEHGIWVAGKVRDAAEDCQVTDLRAAALSGDWRRVDGRLELVAALAVNVPGFPVPRTAVNIHDGQQLALVASGVVMTTNRVPTPADLGRELAELAGFKTELVRMRQGRIQSALAEVGRDPASRIKAAIDEVRV